MTAYPSLSDEEIQSLLPKKESISIMKIVTYSGHVGKIYCVAKIPMFFQLDSYTLLFPTIYTLWHHPYLLNAFTTHTPVVSKLVSGADLMLPGLILKEPVTLYSFGKLSKGTPVLINTEENKVWIFILLVNRNIDEKKMNIPSAGCSRRWRDCAFQRGHVFGSWTWKMRRGFPCHR